MKLLKLITILFIFFGNITYKNSVQAEIKNPETYKVLSNKGKSLSILNVEYYITHGDEFIKNGDFDKAKESYLNARKLAKQLASFYSDLNTAFIGLDSRIPKEMQEKGKEILKVLAESNERLAALYVKNQKADVAVPLLIENIRIMSPNTKEGRKAYKTLIQLGFVETTFKG